MAGLARGLPTRDIFESAVNFEELHYHRGFDEGFKDGVEAGKVEGREVGLKSGFQAGEEIGFYSGCVDLWKAALGVDATAFTPRARRTIRQFEDQLRTYPLSDPENERLHDLIEVIRVRFEAILAMLSIQLDYLGHPKSRDSVDHSDF